MQDLREASTARVTECVALALVIGFFLWEFVTLPIAVHKGLAVSLVGGRTHWSLPRDESASTPNVCPSAASWQQPRSCSPSR